MTEGILTDWIYYAPVSAGFDTVRHVLQEAVYALLTLVLGYPAVGYGPFDPDLIGACWLLEIRCRMPVTGSGPLAAQAKFLREQLQAILGKPARWFPDPPQDHGPRFGIYDLNPAVRERVIALAKGGCHG